MSKLIDVATVARGDGHWQSGLEVETLQCALSSAVAPLCLPAPAATLGGSGSAGPSGHAISSFAVYVSMRQAVMCRTDDPQSVVKSSLDQELDKAAGKALWYGTGNADVWLGATGAYGTDPATKLGDLLKTFYDRTVGVEPIIHMGLQTALETGFIFENGHLAAYPDIDVVINPGYPASGLAITGPIDIWVGSHEVIQTHDIRINREDTAAVMQAALSFDPCAVVVRGLLPDQVYLGKQDMTVTAYAVGSTTSTTIAWGDATGNGTIPANSETGVSHTYTLPGTYTVTVTSESGTTTYTITV